MPPLAPTYVSLVAQVRQQVAVTHERQDDERQLTVGLEAHAQQLEHVAVREVAHAQRLLHETVDLLVAHLSCNRNTADRDVTRLVVQ